jgi:outer membrane receptor protein involved in Fe transport
MNTKTGEFCMKKSRFMIAGSVIGFAMFSAMPAFAQDQKAEDAPVAAEDEAAVPDEAEEETTSGPILVTGSRISRPTLDSAVPITSVTTEDLLSNGDRSIGDALNDLPALRATFSQSNSTRFIGTAGLNVLDLRGLGTARTLTLVNGRRHITVSPGDYIVDVNTIPSELIERVDVVTGGNSAVYGSDAVAGVVNFVLKKNYDGLSLTAQAGVSERGDRGSYFGALTWGKNFADGRGNIAISAEYSKQQPVFTKDRDYLSGAFSGRKQFNLTEPTGGEPFGTDGITDNEFFTNIRNNNISDGGLIGAVCNAGLAANSVRCSPGSTATQFFGTTYLFDQNGNLNANPIDRDLRFVGSNNAVGGLGSTLSNYGMLFPEIERMSVNMLAHFDVSDAFRPFVEAKFVRLNVISESSPSFFQGSIPGFFGGGSNFRCDNPFLTAQAYAQLQTIGRCSTAIPFGATNATTFNLTGRNNVDLGVRNEDNRRDTYRIVGGATGTFNDDWNYELSVNYGNLNGRTISGNNLYLFDENFNNAGFLNAIDAVRNGSGQIVCRINQTTVVDPACVPLNLFGQGRSDPRAVAYSSVTSFYGQKASELVVSGSLSGDLSQLFELPGGPIGFAIGGEYRKESGGVQVDDLTAAGRTFLTALQPVEYPKFSVKEAFGEVRIPLLADVPFFKLLELSGAARISDYNTTAGTTYAYNGTLVWAPIDDVKFRGAYNRSVRVPTQSDLFDPVGQNFATISDPCDILFINNGPNRAANCVAAGVPSGFINTPARSATLSFAQGGNPFLTSEKSDSYTVGTILTPQFLPGLSLTVDYYDITVNNAIATLGAQTIINLCYDSQSIANPYCQLVTRNPDSTFADPAVLSGPVNFARFTTSGIDADLAYRKKFDNGDSFSARFIGSWLRSRDFFSDPTAPLVPNRTRSELGDPEFEFSLSLAYQRGPIGLRYSGRFIGKQTIGTYEAQNPYTGACPTTGVTGSSGRACTPGSIVTLDPLNADQFPQVYYPALMYHDLRVSFDIEKKFQFYLGMDNIFDKKPPFNLLGTGAGSAIYDSTGRYFYAGVKATF